MEFKRPIPIRLRQAAAIALRSHHSPHGNTATDRCHTPISSGGADLVTTTGATQCPVVRIGRIPPAGGR